MDGLKVFNRQDEECSASPEPKIGSGLHLTGRVETREIDLDGRIYHFREVFCKACGDLIKREPITTEQT